MWIQRFGMVLACTGALAAVARAGPLTVRSSHETVEVRQGGKSLTYQWLKLDETMLLRVPGPANVGLQFRKVGEGEAASGHLDLTVVRDDQEQGTVRIRLPVRDDAVLAGPEGFVCTGEVKVKIEIPPGQHTYKLIVTGSGHGALIRPFVGLTERDRVVIATPGDIKKPVVADPPAEPLPKKPVAEVTVAKPSPLAPADPEILPPVAPGVVDSGVIRVDRPGIHRAPSPFGPGTRVSGTTTGMLLAGTITLIVAGTVLEDRARDEPVQIPAGELHDRAERAFEASAILGSLAAAAAVTTLIFWLVEDPEDARAAMSSSGSGVLIRF